MLPSTADIPLKEPTDPFECLSPCLQACPKDAVARCCAFTPPPALLSRLSSNFFLAPWLRSDSPSQHFRPSPAFHRLPFPVSLPVYLLQGHAFETIAVDDATNDVSKGRVAGNVLQLLFSLCRQVDHLSRSTRTGRPSLADGFAQSVKRPIAFTQTGAKSKTMLINDRKVRRMRPLFTPTSDWANGRREPRRSQMFCANHSSSRMTSPAARWRRNASNGSCEHSNASHDGWKLFRKWASCRS